MVLRHAQGPPPDRHPQQIAPGTEASQRDPVPAPVHHRRRAAAAVRPVQDRHRSTSPGQPGTRRHPQRHHQPPARPRRSDTAGGLLRRPRKGLEPATPLLFQRDIGSEHRAFTPTAIRKLPINTLAATGLTNADSEAITFSPHDFRRIFVTEQDPVLQRQAPRPAVPHRTASSPSRRSAVTSLRNSRGLSPVKGAVQDGFDAVLTPPTSRSSQPRPADAAPSQPTSPRVDHRPTMPGCSHTSPAPP